MHLTRKLLGLISKNVKKSGDEEQQGSAHYAGFSQSQNKHKTKAHEGAIWFIILLLTPQKNKKKQALFLL